MTSTNRTALNLTLLPSYHPEYSSLEGPRKVISSSSSDQRCLCGFTEFSKTMPGIPGYPGRLQLWAIIGLFMNFIVCCQLCFPFPSSHFFFIWFNFQFDHTENRRIEKAQYFKKKILFFLLFSFLLPSSFSLFFLFLSFPSFFIFSESSYQRADFAQTKSNVLYPTMWQTGSSSIN